MPQIIKDTLPMSVQMIPESLAAACKKHGIPTFKGKLYKHEGPLTQNVDDWGNPIFDHVNDNTVVLGGAVLALRYLFDSSSGFMPDTLNTIYGVNANVQVPEKSTAVKLFGVGTGGASAEKFGDVVDPDFKQKELVDWIPFRVSDSPTLSASDASKYYFRRQFSSAPSVQYGWYLKELENVGNVEIQSRWKDTVDATGTGALITSDVSGNTSTNLIETYAECILKITEDDIKPYFEFSGDLTMARYNTIGLFTGVKQTIATDYEDYVGVRLFSVVNMDNVSVKIPTECTYLYRIYAAI